MNEQEILILEQFSKLKEPLDRWGKFVDKTLMEILSSFSFDNRLKIPPKCRIKSDKSLLGKALWRSKSYENPLLEIEDKIGTRVVLLTSADVLEASTVISEFSGWQVKDTKNLYSIKDENPEMFTYQSNHFVVWPLPSDDRWLPEQRELLTCEIQIRSLLQHAYAEISHDSAYKGPYKNDNEIIRQLAKSMALMEATDDYFCNVFQLIKDEERYYFNYLKGLAKIFQKYLVSSFSSSDQVLPITELIFKLLDQKRVELDEIEEFTQREITELKSAIHPENGQLFSQPISILVAFYLLNHESFLRTNWPLNEESLKSVYRAFNISYGSF